MNHLTICLMALIILSCDSNVEPPHIPLENSIVDFKIELGDKFIYYDEIYVITYNEPFEDHTFTFNVIDYKNRTWQLDQEMPLLTYRLTREEDAANKNHWWYNARYNNGYLFGKLIDTANEDIIKFMLFVPDTLFQGAIDMFGIRTYWNFHLYGQTLAYFDLGTKYYRTYPNVWHFSSTGVTDIKSGTLNSDNVFLSLYDSTWTYRDLIQNIIDY